MEFPRAGLIYNKEDGAVLCTWSYPVNPENPTDMLTGDCPLATYDEELHEMIDLTTCTYDEYVKIKDKHHEAVIEKAPGKDQGWLLYRKEQGGPQKPHEVGHVKEKVKEQPSEPPPPIEEDV